MEGWQQLELAVPQRKRRTHTCIIACQCEAMHAVAYDAGGRVGEMKGIMNTNRERGDIGCEKQSQPRGICQEGSGICIPGAQV